MKKRILSSLLMGALFLASMSMFTSCKDYDDDINDLQKQITTNATTLQELVTEKIANVETEITSLKAQQSSLETAYKAADDALATSIKNATSDAEGYADIQAAAAQKAAIASAQASLDEAVKTLNASIKTVNDNVLANSNNITNLLAADKVLTQAVSDANALGQQALNRANAAYTLAEANGVDITALKAFQASQEKINASLQDQINTNGDNIKAINDSVAKNKAAIIANTGLIEDLKTSTKTALDNLANEDTYLKGRLDADTKSIDSLATETKSLRELIGTNLTKANGYTDVACAGVMSSLKDSVNAINIKLDAITSAYQAADTQVLTNAKNYAETILGTFNTDTFQPYKSLVNNALDSIKNITIPALKDSIAANKDAIDKNTAAIITINGRLNALQSNLAALVTGVTVQQGAYVVVNYAQISNAAIADGGKIYFPSKTATGAANIASDAGYRYDTNAHNIYVTINPNTVDFDKQDLYLYDSQDGINGNFTSPVKAYKDSTTTLTRAAKNGFYRVEVKNNKVTSKTQLSDDNLYYAVTAQYKSNDFDATTSTYKETTHKVYSKYSVTFNYSALTAATAADFKLTANSAAEASTDANAPTKVTSLDAKFALNNSKQVYAKYIECTGAKNRAGNSVSAAVTEMNKTVGFDKVIKEGEANFDSISKTIPADYSGYTYTFKYYIWNYDGTVVSKTYYVTFTKPLIADETCAITGTPIANTVETTATRGTTFAGLTFIGGSNVDLWKANTAKVVLSSTDAGITGVSFYDANGANEKALTIGGTTALTEIANIKNLAVTYDPSQLTLNTVYTFTLEFLDNNDNSVNKVNVTFKMTAPTSFDGKVSRIASAFTGETTIAWARYNPTTNKAFYYMSGSFNEANTTFDQINGGSYIRFYDTADYTSDATFEPAITDAAGVTTITVPLKAVQNPESEHQYSLQAGVQYFGLQNLWTVQDNFKLKFQSPIWYASWETTTPEVPYPGTVTFGESNIDSKDPSFASHPAINYFATRDSRIASEKLAFDMSDATTRANYGLITEVNGTLISDGVSITIASGDEINFVTGTNVSMTTDVTLKFNLTITDVFGCVKTRSISIKVIKQ